MPAATKWGFHGSAPVFTRVNAVDNRGPVNLVTMKTLLKSVGWTIPISGDGLAAFDGAGADVITSGLSGANGLDNNGAYFVANSPDGLLWLLYSKQSNGGSGGARWIIRSAYTAFTGGAAAPLPTSTTQQNLIPDVSREFLFRSTNPGNFYFAADNASPWGFYAISYPTSASPDKSGIVIPNIQPTDSTDPEPYAYYHDDNSNSMSHQQLGDFANPPQFDSPIARATAAAPLNDPQNAPCAWFGADPGGTGGLDDMWFDTPGGNVQVPFDQLGGSETPMCVLIMQRAGASTDVTQQICKGTNALMLGIGAERATHYDERDYWTLDDGTVVYAAHDIALPWPGDVADLAVDRGSAFILGDIKRVAAAPAPTPGPPVVSSLNPDAFNGGIPFSIRQ